MDSPTGYYGEFYKMSKAYSHVLYDEWDEVYSITHGPGDKRFMTYYPQKDPNVKWLDYVKNHVKYSYKGVKNVITF